MKEDLLNQHIIENPILWTDVPDPDVIRVGDVYYMSSTTMHMNPGVPIMKSYDLLNWEIVSYAYDVLAENEEQTLTNGKHEYGKGSWASSLRYHQSTFYLVVGSLSTGKTYIFTTDNIELGAWKRSTLEKYYHDMSILFDDDGRVYLVYDRGDIKIIELTEDTTAIKEGGLNKVIIPDASLVASAQEDVLLEAEGSHIHKINGYYYVFTITWPKNGSRTQLVHRSDRIDGKYEGRIALDDPSGTAQGGIIDTVDGNWYGLLFRDHGSVGRIPCLIPVTWRDNWPVFGEQGTVPKHMSIPVSSKNIKNNIIKSDEFNYDNNSLEMAWQWNHNPDNQNWSLTERPGYLRMRNGKVSTGLEDARNTLTQRTFGPECSGSVEIETIHMKDGDIAGFAAFQKDYGFVGVKMIEGFKEIVMVNASSGIPEEIESIPIDQEQVYFRIDFDYRNQTDKAYFYYSLDNVNWNLIGNTLQMSYKLDHFMGYRFALFSYATKTTGGFVDFDYFRVELNGSRKIGN
ncbi:glycosyl hydrolase 43 family protein [Anaerobacillus sp. CMMVII]|uniref:glycoside hydrolase family 43 protein n=1 Tax=Anaerobacillus sp. CMMVII TaxID=2755588 RepID=UPI0021B7691E|nr:glycoside hydrolase 43 family protein [Anaerobacillus sp. CMMVII]MCT8139953.1 glycosyl hydrolase 43 family protein [Anaerobacillus sp. CMMVII]